MKFSKEIITGITTIGAIGLLVFGINFLKGNSFFGGDDFYYANFPSSGGVTPATSVYVDGVEIGKVLEVDYIVGGDSLERVRIKFNIQHKNFKLPKGSVLEAGGIDLFSKGIIVKVNPDISKGYYKSGSTIQGIVSVDMMSQVEAYADPITQKLQVMMGSIDDMVTGVSAFWDTTATSEIEASMREVKIAIRKFGDAATQIQDVVGDERVKLSRIMSNVQSITETLKESDDQVKHILGNIKTVTDDMVTMDFKGVMGDAQKTLQSVNAVLDAVTNGNGTLSKLINDEALYNELVETNADLQNLLKDLQLHPERYIHFSVIGGKTKGVVFTPKEEAELKKLLNK
ncbi:MAG: MCE family protein [Crocinitomicaceae bacterium]|nr:MlaD family protein [Flavobacteriales bacterium]NQZ37787.1 MCE family protein [Crocinitomicaceae bacterium]